MNQGIEPAPCESCCPSEALTLERKPGSKDVLLPSDMVDMWRTVRDMQAGNCQVGDHK